MCFYISYKRLIIDKTLLAMKHIEFVNFLILGPLRTYSITAVIDSRALTSIIDCTALAYNAQEIRNPPCRGTQPKQAFIGHS